MTKHRKRSLIAPVLLLMAFSTALLVTFSLLTLSPASAKNKPGLPLPQWGTDVDVNTVEADNHEAFSLAINPTDTNTVLASFKYENEQGRGSGYALSTDAGRSWAGGSFTGTWGSDLLVPSGNTSVGYNAQGVAYLASRAETLNEHGYFVLTSTDGINWGAPVTVLTATNSIVHDQAHLAVDRRASGNYAGSVYLVWHYSPANDAGIWESYSRDGGTTWSAPVQVTNPVNNYTSHPSVAVTSDGSIYVTSMQLDNGCYCVPPRLYVNKSTDGGVTWGPDQLVTGDIITPVGALDSEGHDLVLRGTDNPEAGVEVNNFPVIAVSPSDPNAVYVAWNDGRWDTDFEIYSHPGKHGDIAFSRSTDAGATWSSPVRVNDDTLANGVDQFMPAIAVGPDGTIGISWYDRRVDTATYNYDVFYSQSVDGGLTWSANQRVSDESSDPMVGANAEGVGDLGEYRAMAIGPDYVLPAWLDSRDTQTQQFYVDTGEAVTPTPTATVVASETTTPTSSPVASETTVPTSTSTPVSTQTATPLATPTLTPCTNHFSDVQPSDYFYEGVVYLSCHGVISGYGDGTFRPYNHASRGQMSKIVVLAEGWQLSNPATATFRDVPVGSTFFPYVETAYTHGIVSGYSCGPGCAEFRPGNDVTRAQLTKMIVLARNWAVTPPTQPTFSDVPASNSFFGYVETAYAHGIVSGYSCGQNCVEFRPGNPATRGQTSKMVYLAITNP